MKGCVSFVALLFCCTLVFSQVHEGGINLGVSNLYGDLGGSPHKGTRFFIDLEPRLFRPSIGVYYRNQFAPHFLFKTSINYCVLHGDDNLVNAEPGQDGYFRQMRGIKVRTPVAELTAEFEYAWMYFRPGSRKYRFTPYIGLGAGAFYFNPKGPYGNGWVALRPLSTEGQGFAEYPDVRKYWIVQPVITACFGLKYNFNRHFSIGANLNVRKTFTDYLDDTSKEYIDPEVFGNHFSPAKAAMASYFSNPTGVYKPGDIRGNRKDKDSYFLIYFNLQYHFGRSSFSCPRRL